MFFRDIRRPLVLAAIFSFILLFIPRFAVAQAISVGNFSFETPTTTTNINDPASASWTFTNGGARYAGIAAASVVGGSAPDGSQVCYIQSTSSISQSLSGFVPGATYAVTVASGYRSGTPVDSVNITINGTAISSFTPSTATYADYTATFVATSSSETIGFAGTIVATNEANLDKVRVNQVTNSISVGNFSFETPTTTTNINDPASASWTFTNGGARYAGIAAAGVVGGSAPDGSQVCYIQSTSSISQSLSGFVPGATYAVTVASGYRSGTPVDSMNIAINGTVISSFTPSTTTYSDYTATFVATSSSETVGFVGTVSATNEANLDKVRVNLVPTPSNPLSLVATAGIGQISLTWSASTAATTYSVYRGVTPGGEGATAYSAGITGTTFLDSAAIPGTTYYYTVVAVNASGGSGMSNEASAAAQLSAPGNVTATPGDKQIVLGWNAVGYATSYNVYRATTAGGEGATPVASNITSASYTNTGLTNGTTYYFKIAAVNAGGTSGQSVEVNAKPGAAPVITSSSSATAYVGVSFSFQITATNTPTMFNATGLPPGLSVNTTTGAISGTPTSMGQWPVSLSASNGTGAGTSTFTITVATLPTAPYICTP